MLLHQECNVIPRLEVYLKFDDMSEKTEVLEIGYRYDITYAKGPKMITVNGIVEKLIPASRGDDFIVVLDCSNEYDSKVVRIISNTIRDIYSYDNNNAGGMEWESIGSTAFADLVDKDENKLYFIYDTKELYKGDVCYSESVILVTELPEVGAKNKLYVNPETKEGSVFDGENWIQVFKPIVTELGEDETLEDIDDDSLVSFGTIKLYINESITELLKQEISNNVNGTTITAGETIEVKGVNIGNYKDGDTIDLSTSMVDILKNILQVPVPPEYIAPVLELNKDAVYESGNILTNYVINPVFTQNDAGEVIKYTLTRENNGVSTVLLESDKVEPYTEPMIYVPSNMIMYIATVEYAEGPIKNDNFDNPCDTGHILAGSSTTPCCIKGFNKAFYGSDMLDSPCSNSSQVRELPACTENTLEACERALKVDCNVGDTRVTIAYPAELGNLATIRSDTTGMNVISNFSVKSINVCGLNGMNPKPYLVYTYLPEVAYPLKDKYIISF